MANSDHLQLSRQSLSTFHSWPKLPNELKLVVLGYHLTCSESIDLTEKDVIVQILGPLQCALNKELYNLALEVYLKTNTFWASVSVNKPQHPIFRFAPWVRKLHLRVSGCSISPGGYFDHDCGWWLLFKPTTYVYSETKRQKQLSRWLRRFSGLDELHLEIVFSGSHLQCIADRKGGFLISLSASKTKLKTRMVKVTVRGLRCMDDRHNQDSKEHSCKEDIERLLTEKLEKKDTNTIRSGWDDSMLHKGLWMS